MFKLGSALAFIAAVCGTITSYVSRVCPVRKNIYIQRIRFTAREAVEQGRFGIRLSQYFLG